MLKKPPGWPLCCREVCTLLSGICRELGLPSAAALFLHASTGCSQLAQIKTAIRAKQASRGKQAAAGAQHVSAQKWQAALHDAQFVGTMVQSIASRPIKVFQFRLRIGPQIRSTKRQMLGVGSQQVYLLHLQLTGALICWATKLITQLFWPGVPAGS